jgi:2-keto-4-pentenoate hydratase/2-oxohepta-3-ene-1,7-dioic acid hydratase in catechol pathway
VQGMFVFGKNLDATAPCGPWMTTDDTIGDPENLRLRCWVNGAIRQDETTANMIFTLGELVAHCSRDITLQPGDLIATGCPAGCGIFFDPPEAGLLHDGDLVEMEIDGIGRLSNRVVASF